MFLGAANKLVKKHKINRMNILPYVQRKSLFPKSKKQKVSKSFWFENVECFLHLRKVGKYLQYIGENKV